MVEERERTSTPWLFKERKQKKKSHRGELEVEVFEDSQGYCINLFFELRVPGTRIRAVNIFFFCFRMANRRRLSINGKLAWEIMKFFKFLTIYLNPISKFVIKTKKNSTFISCLVNKFVTNFKIFRTFLNYSRTFRKMQPEMKLLPWIFPLRKKTIKNYSKNNYLKILKNSNYLPMLNWRIIGETIGINGRKIKKLK